MLVLLMLTLTQAEAAFECRNRVDGDGDEESKLRRIGDPRLSAVRRVSGRMLLAAGCCS